MPFLFGSYFNPSLSPNDWSLLGIKLVWLLVCGLTVTAPTLSEANEPSTFENNQALANKVQVVPSKSDNPALVSLLGNQIEDFAESPDGRIFIASRTGVLTFDTGVEKVLSSYVFDHPYDDVQVIPARDSVWIHGRIDRTTSLTRQPIEEHHEILRLEGTELSFSFRCTSVGVAEYVGYQVVDFGGDELPSLVTLCWDGKDSHYANVVDLNRGAVKKIVVPFPATGALIGEQGVGRQSLVLLSFDPRSLYRCREGWAISQCGVSRSISSVTFVIEQNNEHELVGRLDEAIPMADSYETHEVARFLYSKVYLHGELLLNNVTFKGQLLLQWNVEGQLKNWWNFKRRERVRDILKWINIPPSTSSSNGISAVVLTRVWGDWCRWTNCGYRVIQLSNAGVYKVIDSTTHRIDDIMITSENDLIASWNGKVYRYDLKKINETVPWQKSRLTAKQKQWISEHID